MKIRLATAEDEAGMVAVLYACDLMQKDLPYHHWTPPVYVAEQDGDIVGFIQGLVGHPYSVITDCAVLPEHRGRCGPALLAALEQTFRAVGVTAWACYTSPSNPYEPWVRRMAKCEPNPGNMYLKRLT